MAHTATFSAGIARPARSFGWLAGLRKAISDRATYYRTVRELSGLTDRELADLGVSRFHIEQVAREAVYGA